MHDQIARVLPILSRLFDGMAVQASSSAPGRSLALLAAAGAAVRRTDTGPAAGIEGLGRARRDAVELALRHAAPAILFFDFDGLLHWAERYPELKALDAYYEKADGVPPEGNVIARNVWFE